jgi:hypothetical protein
LNRRLKACSFQISLTLINNSSSLLTYSRQDFQYQQAVLVKMA